MAWLLGKGEDRRAGGRTRCGRSTGNWCHHKSCSELADASPLMCRVGLPRTSKYDDARAGRACAVVRAAPPRTGGGAGMEEGEEEVGRRRRVDQPPPRPRGSRAARRAGGRMKDVNTILDDGGGGGDGVTVGWLVGGTPVPVLLMREDEARPTREGSAPSSSLRHTRGGSGGGKRWQKCASCLVTGAQRRELRHHQLLLGWRLRLRLGARCDVVGGGGGWEGKRVRVRLCSRETDVLALLPSSAPRLARTLGLRPRLGCSRKQGRGVVGWEPAQQ